MLNLISLFDSHPDDGLIHAYSYDPMLVSISIVLAVIASYIALKFGGKISSTEKVKEKNILSLVSAITMGLASGLCILSACWPLTYQVQSTYIQLQPCSQYFRAFWALSLPCVFSGALVSACHCLLAAPCSALAFWSCTISA